VYDASSLDAVVSASEHSSSSPKRSESCGLESGDPRGPREQVVAATAALSLQLSRDCGQQGGRAGSPNRPLAAFPRPRFLRSGQKFKATNADGPLGDRTLPPTSIALSLFLTVRSGSLRLVVSRERRAPGRLFPKQLATGGPLTI
jgi:hypothetical protein